MNERLQKIADDLGTKVYKEPLHGQIAKDNFIYGVAQAEIEFIDKACEWLTERTAFGVHPCSGTALVMEFKKFMEEE